MKRALLIKNREYNGICIDFVLAKLMGNRDSIENHRQTGTGKEIVNKTVCAGAEPSAKFPNIPPYNVA